MLGKGPPLASAASKEDSTILMSSRPAEMGTIKEGNWSDSETEEGILKGGALDYISTDTLQNKVRNKAHAYYAISFEGGNFIYIYIYIEKFLPPKKACTGVWMSNLTSSLKLVHNVIYIYIGP